MRLLPFSLALYVACELDPGQLARPNPTPAPVVEAGPPPAEGPARQALYQVLFAGEQGAPARAWGQRARMLAWFRYMALEPAQLDGLAALSAAIEARQARLVLAEAEAAARELASLQPVYVRLTEALAAQTEPDEAELAALGTALEGARKAASPGTLHRLRSTELRGMLDDTQAWIEVLDPSQQAALGSSRFLLAHQVGALVAPGDYATLLGTEWDGMAFDALVLGRVPTEQEPLDIGGLWATEQVRGTPDHALSAVQKQVLALLAARQEGLREAIEVAQGRRAATEGLPPLPPSPPSLPPPPPPPASP